jgi:hypothetical protein
MIRLDRHLLPWLTDAIFQAKNTSSFLSEDNEDSDEWLTVDVEIVDQILGMELDMNDGQQTEEMQVKLMRRQRSRQHACQI